jgi:Concanavalin A-like lectin/glucanases superfamily
MLFEIRVIDGRWCLDAFNHTGQAEKALLNRQNLHELGRWFHVAAVYDGREFRSYVNGVQDGAAEIRLAPQGQGRTAVGMRMNKSFYFKGAVRMARFTRRALALAEFLNLPTKN